MADQPRGAESAVLKQLAAEGVTLWLSGASRRELVNGALRSAVSRTGITGAVLSARTLGREVRERELYLERINRLSFAGVSPAQAMRSLCVDDARWACDILRPAFDETSGATGHVSVDLDPRLAHDAAATVREAQALYAAVGRPNLLIKVPATAAGVRALSDCLFEGVGVNATLVYSLKRYEEVLDAYFDGLDRMADAGREIAGVGSVASFDVFRLGEELDERLGEPDGAGGVRGKSAVAFACLAYQVYEDRLGSPQWRHLRAKGARPQRLAWAEGDGTEPDSRRDSLIRKIIAWNTVHTVTRATLESPGWYGDLQGDSLTGGRDRAARVRDGLARLGISPETVAAELEAEGVGTLTESWTRTLGDVGSALGRDGRR
ncbi:transaldolase family protein [Streptomyces sp. SID7909]|uniref:transaldolase family protein n=1 Tax=Streptomyces sp. SID7909 TaxID=2706092 RepID=UPI0013BA07F1|nr:transaldolase family protein [Streptomyces sp. SID7909]NEC08213.1 transaldolase [Streptomyces sp. SID7909]